MAFTVIIQPYTVTIRPYNNTVTIWPHHTIPYMTDKFTMGIFLTRGQLKLWRNPHRSTEIVKYAIIGAESSLTGSIWWTRQIALYNEAKDIYIKSCSKKIKTNIYNYLPEEDVEIHVSTLPILNLWPMWSNIWKILLL